METVFFSIFRRLLPVTVFFRLVETPISTKSSILAGGNGFSGYWELFFFFVHKFFLPVETVKEISERQFLKKKHIVTNVTDFLLSGNHFLRFSQTGVNCCHWKQFCLQVKHIFQPILHSGWWKRVLSQLKTVLFCLKFFSAGGNYYWNLGEVNFWRWNILVKY